MKLLEHQVASAFPQPALGAQVVERVNKLVATALDQPHAISGRAVIIGCTQHLAQILSGHAIELARKLELDVLECWFRIEEPGASSQTQ